MAGGGARGWNEQELVERFAGREPDVRLAALLDEYTHPGATRVLDLGCAGGRNTELLARRGFDVFAVDFAVAMVETTRARLVPILGKDEAERRVRVGEMRELSAYGALSFQLVIALGIFQQAQTEEEWYEALAEAARVLAPGGRCLVANFAPGTGAVDAPLRPIEGTRFLHEGLHVDRLCLRAPADLDRDLGSVGLVPEVQTVLVERVEGKRRRVTANGLYRKTGVGS